MFEILVLSLILILVFGFISLFLLMRKINKNLSDRDLQVEEKLKKVNESSKSIVDQVILLDKKLDDLSDLFDHLVLNQILTINNQLKQIEFLIKSHYIETLSRELLATQDTLAMMSELIMTHRKTGIEVTDEMVVAFRNREAEIITLNEIIQNYEREV